ncbi:hypothetical protein BU15DRAFT_82796 [Melanogaster broomeanus]|nr:hypothetical protein BU15DRAFT_82796 [Melanogaster broomeanus]
MPSYDSRKFVDLILTASSKWANWDPPKPIHVGDYGTISRKTGEFLREGNIFKPSADVQRLLDGSGMNIDLGEGALEPEVAKGDDHQFITASGAYANKAQIAANVNVQNQANAGLHVNFGFGDKGGALLVMYKPEYSSLPTGDGHLTSFLKAAHKAVKDRYIVTEVVSCPAYLMAMSREKTESFSASLSVTVTPAVPVATASASASLAWSHDMINGVHRSGSDANFVPLYKLSQPQQGFWAFLYPSGHRGHSENESLKWESVHPPWDKLNDDGEEMERYDPTMYADEEPDWEVECEQ